ncbi:MAG TPA: tetratricopeptide repeat protein, partial [Usitatibacter sp.]
MLLERFPGDPRVLASIAAAHRKLGNHELASTLCDQALSRPAIAPREIATLAYTLAALGRLADAKSAATRAASMAPDSVEVRACAAEALALAGYSSEAAEHFAAVAIHRPRSASVLESLGLASIASGDWARAAQAFEDEERLAPGKRGPLHHLAVALTELGRRDEAIAVLERALEAGHRDAEILSVLVQVKGMACDWEGLDALAGELREVAQAPCPRPAQPQAALYLTGVGAAEQRTWAENWARVRFAQTPAASRPSEPPTGRLRLGYLSADFYDHATSLLVAGMLEHHDSDRFEVFAYSGAADDGSTVRRRLVQAVDRFVDIRGLPQRLAAERIAADGLDVLVDLGGYVKNSLMGILAYRPAPLQGHFLGYPGTTGAPFVDFFVADGITVAPGGETAFTEKVLRMPACYQPNDPRRIEPARRSRSECGLSEDAIVLCSFNQAHKMRAPVFDRWCRLLDALPRACLWLADNGDSANDRLRGEARHRGVDPARLV